jgi:hypothetical protein
MSLDHDTVLVKDLVVRRKQARTAWIVTTVLGSVPMYLLLEHPEGSDLAAVMVFVAMASVAASGGAAWLSFGRYASGGGLFCAVFTWAGGQN